MSLPDSITREDLIHATEEIVPLDSSGNPEPASSIILLNGHRYDPEVVLTRAVKNTTGTEVNETGIPQDDASLASFYAERNIPFIPSIKIDTAVQTLKTLYANPVDIQNRNFNKIIAARDPVLNRFQPLFTPEQAAALPREDFEDFLKLNSGHWYRQSRSQSKLVQNFDQFRKALAILVDEKQPIHARLDTIKPDNGPNMTSGAAEGILTAILMVEYPERYGVWNMASIKALNALNIWPKSRRGASFGERYLTINEVLKSVAREAGVDLWTLDALWGGIDTQKSETGQFEATINIAQTIAEIGLDNKKLGHAPDAPENQERYNTIIKPLLDEFKTKYQTTPQLYLRDILNKVISRMGLSDDYDCKGFHFLGQKVHSFTWAAITRKDPSITDRKASHYPELFITVNRKGIKYGFSYGDLIKDSDKSVTRIREQSELREQIVSIMKANTQLHAFRTSTGETMPVQADDITKELIGGDFSEWTSAILLVESHDTEDIPGDMVDRIVSTLSALVPVLLQVSEPKVKDPKPEPVPETDSIPDPQPAPTWSTVSGRLACSFTGDQIPFAGLHFPDADKQRLSSEILGALRSGKHIILTGPPGTGKSKIAQAICAAIAGPGNFQMCTASPDWSVYETIGGYRPKSDGTLRFHPGAFLRSFRNGDEPANRWLIIDEINRADIDKAFGSLFSALAGDRVDLPFEIDDEPVCLVGRPGEETLLNPCTFIIHPDWRIIATMNTFDKSSLYEMSYAFMRRFAFIMVDSQKMVDAGLVGEYARAWGFKQDEERCRQVAKLWNLVNRHRKIGPALFRDIYQYFDQAPGAAMESAVSMYLFPQLEGLPEETQKLFVTDLLTLESIVDTDRLKQNAATFFHIDIRGFP